MKINVKPIIAALLCTALMVCTACSGGKTETGKPESADSKASTVSEAASDTSKNDTVSAASSENSTGESITEESESSDDESSTEESESSDDESSTEENESSDDESSTEESENSDDESSTKPSADNPHKDPDPSDAKETGALPPLPDDDGTDVGYMSNGILIYNRTAYELFYGYDELAKDYSAAMSKLKNALGDGVKVYNLLVPTHCGVTLPERFFSEYGLPDQKEYLDTIINNYTADIIGINAYDIIAHHRDEYVYFNSDHHWTGLAAYYAYKAFCKAAGVDCIPLSDMTEGTIEGYYGSLTNYIDESLVDPDTVHYYTMDADTSTVKYDSYGQDEQTTSLMHTYASSSFAYGVFLGGDNPLIVCKNKNGNGKKIAVVHESYGNAFCPYIAFTYSETHMIDFRDIEFDFKKYIKDNGIDEIIFINNAMASATPFLCEKLASFSE